jgi:hypothetical protein
MTKKEGYKKVISGLLNEFLKKGDEEGIMDYLVSNSNLPGPRGNLEVAEAFADLVEDRAEEESEKLWNLCAKLTAFPQVEAPVNDPKEFLVFCGTEGIGALGSLTAFFQRALSRLKELANDSRWRTREGVAMAIQRLIRKWGEETMKHLGMWIEKNNWLVMRAVAAGVAEPDFLRDKKIAESALELHRKVFAHILTTEERKSAEFKTLRQALGYSLSVVIRAIPKEGFEYMRQIVDSQDADVLWIVKENLKKDRLTRNFPDEVVAMKEYLITKV